MRGLAKFAMGVCAVALLGADAVQAQGPTYDILIKNAHILDGTGNPWFNGDVAITNGVLATELSRI